MKTPLKITSIYFVAILFMASECRDTENCHDTIKVENHSDKGFYILDHRVYYIERDSLFIPDISLKSFEVTKDLHCAAKGTGKLWTRSCFEGTFVGNGIRAKYLHVMLFDEDVIRTVPHDTVRKHVMTLKRYYLTLEDLQALNWTVIYPPTEAMKDIQQWPPYSN